MLRPYIPAIWLLMLAAFFALFPRVAAFLIVGFLLFLAAIYAWMVHQIQKGRAASTSDANFHNVTVLIRDKATGTFKVPPRH